MPFWAGHETVSSTSSAGSRLIGQDATPSCPGLAIERSLCEGPLDDPEGSFAYLRAFVNDAAPKEHRPGLHESRGNHWQLHDRSGR
jgi:hypothetical protein